MTIGVLLRSGSRPSSLRKRTRRRQALWRLQTLSSGACRGRQTGPFAARRECPENRGVLPFLIENIAGRIGDRNDHRHTHLGRLGKRGGGDLLALAFEMIAPYSSGDI